jgi:hypothetical protein
MPDRMKGNEMNENPRSLPPCRECGNPVSVSAAACPKCGAPSPAVQDWTGTGFEWKSRKTVYGWPLVHVAFGHDARGKYRVARGVVAVGQFALGLVTVAQFGVGVLFGFGQFILGLTSIAQVAVTVLFGIGQFATGYAAVGQFVVAYYGLAQAGLAKHLWSMHVSDPEAARFFISLAKKIGLNIGHWFNVGR